jgi:hypothetical protein
MSRIISKNIQAGVVLHSSPVISIVDNPSKPNPSPHGSSHLAIILEASAKARWGSGGKTNQLLSLLVKGRTRNSIRTSANAGQVSKSNASRRQPLTATRIWSLESCLLSPQAAAWTGYFFLGSIAIPYFPIFRSSFEADTVKYSARRIELADANSPCRTTMHKACDVSTFQHLPHFRLTV